MSAARSEAALLALADVAALYLRLVSGSGRLRREIDPAAEAMLGGGGGAIIAFRHARAALLPVFAPKGRKMSVLVPPDRRGLFAAEVIRRFGVTAILGPSGARGMRGLRRILDTLGEGGLVAFAARPSKGGDSHAIARLAHRSGCAVLPVAVAAKLRLRVRRLDGLMLPLPFSPLCLVAAAPLIPGEAVGAASLGQAIAQALDAAGERADRALGVSPGAAGG